LLYHVTDPTGRRSNEHAERKRADLEASALVAHECVTHLRPVTVHDAEVPAITREIDDGAETRARVAELIIDRAPLARRRESISSQRNDGGRRDSRIHGECRGKLDSAHAPGKLTESSLAARGRAHRMRVR